MTSQIASKGTAIESSQDFAHAIDLLGVHDSPPHRSLLGPLLIAGQDADYMRGALSAAGDITVNAVVLRSKGGDDSAEALLEHARQHDFDLIAPGTQAHTALDRHLTGSGSTAPLRGAQCAVLMSPSR